MCFLQCAKNSSCCPGRLQLAFLRLHFHLFLSLKQLKNSSQRWLVQHLVVKQTTSPTSLQLQSNWTIVKVRSPKRRDHGWLSNLSPEFHIFLTPISFHSPGQYISTLAVPKYSMLLKGISHDFSSCYSPTYFFLMG